MNLNYRKKKIPKFRTVFTEVSVAFVLIKLKYKISNI